MSRPARPGAASSAAREEQLDAHRSDHRLLHPPSSFLPADGYLAHALEIARWSEAHGCRGMLVYTDNGLLDPWLAQEIVRHTQRLVPLVAVQPVWRDDCEARWLLLEELPQNVNGKVDRPALRELFAQEAALR